MPNIPVLEVGGTHVTGAVVHTEDWTIVRSRRLALDSSASAEHILGRFVEAGADLGDQADLPWGVAMPDPFDYGRGIATFRDVGKFDAIYGVDVGAVLRDRLPFLPASVAFVNDADAFILGEWTIGAARGHRRCVGITLGTGLGSGWLVDGVVTATAPGVPAHGRARTLIVDGAGLEETMSRRAVRNSYAQRTGDDTADVLDIATRARAGEVAAVATLSAALDGLGRAMGPAMREFGADVIVIGGSMAGSWDLFEPWFRQGMDWIDAPPIRVAADADAAALVGAARIALDPNAASTG